MGDWTFFSNHGHVLVCLAKNHQARLRDVALDVGITERAVQKIVRDFQDAGIVTVSKQGRCNRYRINRRKALRHDLESHCTVGKLLTLVAKPAKTGRKASVPSDSDTQAEKEQQQHSGEPAVEEQAAESKPESPAEPSSADPRPGTRQQGSLF